MTVDSKGLYGAANEVGVGEFRVRTIILSPSSQGYDDTAQVNQ